MFEKAGFRSRFAAGVLTSYLLAAVIAAPPAGAQGVTSGAVSGVVRDEHGSPLDRAEVEVINRETGFRTVGVSRRDGSYLVQGLEVGGPYSITAKRMGFLPKMRDGQTISLSQELRIDFTLARQATLLAAMDVLGERDEVLSAERTGAATIISDTALRRLPTLDRNFTDFVVLAPQVSVAGPGLSGGGVNNRFNNIQIDGASENDLFGLGSTGQPGGQARGRSIGLEAVKSYQVLLAPFDVRHGNFAGLLVNAVTQHGSNELRGSLFYVTRRAGLARDVDYIRSNEFEQTQYGFSIGGPLVRDRVHFFFSPEFQTRREPAAGPFRGGVTIPFPASAADVDRFGELLRGYGVNAGTAGPIDNHNPLTNLFTRFDIALPFNSRVVLRHNFGRAEDDILSREPSLIRLSSNGYEFSSRKNATVAQLYTNFSSGASNELIVGYNTIRDRRRPNVVAPQIQVTVPSASGTGTVDLRAGSDNSSQGNLLDQDILELTNNFTVPLGRHRLTVGAKNEFYRIRNVFAQNSFGQWEFLNLDSLARGAASRYQVGVSLGSGMATKFTAGQFGAYVQDQWEISDRFRLTSGLRLDVPWFGDKPAYNQSVEAAFGRRTDEIPSGWLQLSPRVGFNWNLSGDRDRQLRGGAGVFVGRPAFVWLGNAFQNSGQGLGQLTCQNSSTAAAVPRFPGGDPAQAPTSCADGTSAASAADIDLLSKKLRFPQYLKGSLAYDQRLWYGWVASLEGLYAKAMHNFFYTNRALAGPQGVDRHGRTVYGGIAPTGVSSPALVSNRRNVIDVQNSSRDYSFNLTAALQKRFANQFEFAGSYTYSQARDVQSLANSTALSNWRFGRALSGNQFSQDLERSRFELPHHVVLAGTYTFSTRTDLSVIYVGLSGSNYDYVYGGSGGRGDLNADGAQGNDLVYVPLRATDPTEIQLSGVSSEAGADNSPAAQARRVAEQQSALERFIENTECLKEQRGQILTRNSCRTPWANMLNVSLRQSVPVVRGQALSLQIDVFNLLNLINKNWGEQPAIPGGQGSVALFTHVGQTNGPVAGPQGSQGIFTFDTGFTRFDKRNPASNYQIQLSARYSF